MHAKRPRHVARAGAGPQVALLGRGAAALEQAGTERQAECPGRALADDGRLVVAALEIARAMERHRQDDFRQRPRDGAPRLRKQQAEQPPVGRLAMELQCLHAVVDGPVVPQGRDEEVAGRHPQRGRTANGRGSRQRALAGLAQVDGLALAIAAPRRQAQQAGRRQAEAHGRTTPAHDCRPAQTDVVDNEAQAPEHARIFAAPNGPGHVTNPLPSPGNAMNWTVAEVERLFALPFLDLLFAAQQVHREHHDPRAVQLSTLLSIKTGACPEDCAYCPQSIRHESGVGREGLLPLETVRERARAAKAAGATRFCMGAAWRSPKPQDIERVAAMVRAVRALGLETCATLGMLTPAAARQLKDAGLDYYNHNLDTSARYYGEIITTRTYQDPLDTLAAVRDAGLRVCCGGIIGMGEGVRDRAALLVTLAGLPEPPQSVPINRLVPVRGTPLADAPPLDPFDFVRTIAVARIVLPRATLRLSAGRETMSDELQALCFLAGAGSIFHGERLLTTGNPDATRDQQLLARLGLAARGAGTLPRDAAT